MTEAGAEDKKYFSNCEIYLSYACNRSCRFCFVEKEEREQYACFPDFRELCSYVLKIKKQGFDCLSLLGGEPTLYPKLAELILFAKKAGIGTVNVFSNGLRFADKKYTEEIIRAGADGLHLNIPSHKEEIFDYLTRSRNGFRALLDALRNLKESGIPTLAVCVLNSYNYRDLKDYAAFLADFGIKIFVVHYMKLQGNASSSEENIRDIAVPMELCGRPIKEMADFCVSSGLYPPFVEHLPPCILGSYAGCIIDFGQKEEDKSGNACIHPDRGLSNTWDVSYEGREYAESCSGCLWRRRCYGLEKNYLRIFPDSKTAPVKKVPEPYYKNFGVEQKKKALSSLPEAMTEIKMLKEKEKK